MILYPTIEILNGHCVSLRAGRIEDPAIWHVDPVETAHAMAQAGAEWLQITNFDAIDGRDDSDTLVIEMMRAAGVSVQLAGGFRSREAVERWIDLGAGRIVLGTLAVTEPDIVREIAKYHPDQIVLSLDVYNDHLLIDGWRNPTAITPEAMIEAFAGVPLAAIKITDVAADAGETDHRLGVISGLAALSRTPVIASGVVRELDDIARLKYIPGIAGAIVGRALFNRTLDLAEAFRVAQPTVEKTAEFM